MYRIIDLWNESHILKLCKQTSKSSSYLHEEHEAGGYSV